jgi:uncharacterized protein
MASYFFDSSSLMKRYTKEKGSAWVISLFRPFSNNRIHVAEITYVEVISALSRRHRGKSISTSKYKKAVDRFRRNFKSKFFATDIDTQLIEIASNLAEKHILRGYDAVQLGCAVQLHQLRQKAKLSPFIFVSADDALNQAALNEGLTVDNPNNYP